MIGWCIAVPRRQGIAKGRWCRPWIWQLYKKQTSPRAVNRLLPRSPACHTTLQLALVGRAIKDNEAQCSTPFFTSPQVRQLFVFRHPRQDFQRLSTVK